MHIVVIGAGIIGVSTAYFLARAGHSIRVLEQATGPGQGCSFANGGQFSYSYTEPLASPSLLKQFPLLLLRRSSPLAVKIAALPGLIKWSRHFVRNCNTRCMQENMLKVLRLSLHSRRMLHGIQEREGLTFEYRRSGKLHLYFDEAALTGAKPFMELKNRLGCRQQMLSSRDCVDMEPALRHSVQSIEGGVYSPLDESGDTYSLTRALAETCTASGMVDFSFDCAVQSFQRRNGEIVGVMTNRGIVAADAFVICAGASSVSLCHGLGLQLPIQPAKGYSVTLPAGIAAPRVSITDTRAKTVYSLLGDRLRIAGLLDFAGFDYRDNYIRFNRLIDTARDVFPEASNYTGERKTWAGLRPLSPDGAPIIGATCFTNLYLNTGHGMLGSTLACGSAALITDIMDGRQPEVDATGFSPQRFRS